MTDSNPSKKLPRRADRTLSAVIAVVGALVVTALVVVFSRGTAAPLDSRSPEATVQQYTAAVVAGDEAAATAFLSDEWLESCDPNQGAMTGGTGRMRVTLVSTTERSESADVRVLISTSYQGDVFGSGSSSYEVVFDLIKVDQRWKIDSAPWELAVCTTGVKGQ